MPGAAHGIYCERCGAFVDLLVGAPMHPCPDCNAVACAACWDNEFRRCDGCAAIRRAYGDAPKPLSGVAGGREVLADLRALRSAMAERLDPERRADPNRSAVTATELLLLHACATALDADAQAALDRTARRSAPTVGDLRRELAAEMAWMGDRATEARLELVRADATSSSEPERPAPPQRPAVQERSTRPVPPRRVRRPFTVRRAWLASAAVGCAVVVVAIAARPQLIGSSNGLSPAGADDPSAEDRGGVLGGDPAPPTPSDEPTAPAAVTQVTFDDWRMGSEMGAEWRIERGAPDQVTVAPFPSAVNRSLALIAASDGLGATACRTIDRTATEVALDAWIETPETGLQVAVRGASGADAAAIWALTTSSAGGAGTAASVPVTVAEWHKLEVGLDLEAAVAQWQVLGPGSGPEGTPIAAGVQNLTGEADAICVSITDGAAGSRALIDNLMIGERP